ncbi:hypothetical protein AKJ16_DCAP08253 [Drosera capensis]
MQDNELKSYIYCGTRKFHLQPIGFRFKERSLLTTFEIFELVLSGSLKTVASLSTAAMITRAWMDLISETNRQRVSNISLGLSNPRLVRGSGSQSVRTPRIAVTVGVLTGLMSALYRRGLFGSHRHYIALHFRSSASATPPHLSSVYCHLSPSLCLYLVVVLEFSEERDGVDNARLLNLSPQNVDMKTIVNSIEFMVSCVRLVEDMDPLTLSKFDDNGNQESEL